MSTTIPNDTDGLVIRRVLARGSDPTRPMSIDFMIACPDADTGGIIVPIVSALGHLAEIEVDEEDQSVTCRCTKEMLLVYDDLIAAQEELDGIAKPHGGFIDGWGTFGNASSS